MRRLPNALSLLRIPLSAWMLSVRPFSAGFWAAYLLGGLTDGLDGFLARRFAAVSRRGAMLDSLADAAFFLALLIVLRGVFRPTWTRVWLAAVFAVRMACVIGVPDERTGEAGAAFIDLREGESCTWEEILPYCRDRLADFQFPKYHFFLTRDQWPLNATGKLIRYQLRKMAQERIAALAPETSSHR